jgi:hypothetical protein
MLDSDDHFLRPTANHGKLINHALGFSAINRLVECFSSLRGVLCENFVAIMLFNKETSHFQYYIVNKLQARLISSCAMHVLIIIRHEHKESKVFM